MFKNLRQVPANLLNGATDYIAQHPWQTLGATAVLGGVAGASMFPSSTYSPQEIIAAAQTDKDLLVDQMAKSGKYSNEELIAASQLTSDELMQLLAQDQRDFNLGGTLLGGAAGAGLGAAGLGMLSARRAAAVQ